jgi:hypothetical protein
MSCCAEAQETIRLRYLFLSDHQKLRVKLTLTLIRNGDIHEKRRKYFWWSDEKKTSTDRSTRQLSLCQNGTERESSDGAEGTAQCAD